VHAHDIHVRDVSRMLEADFDIEVQSDMDLREAHAVATRLEQAVLQNNQLLRRVTTHLEAPNNTVVQREDVTQQYAAMADDIRRIADTIAGVGSAHDIHLYCSEPVPVHADAHMSRDQQDGKHTDELDLVLHTIFDANEPLSEVHVAAEEIKRTLRLTYSQLGSVVIHTEPPES
jgi:divalent metal cation (Fe/Co/Zn/Cd) transporter